MNAAPKIFSLLAEFETPEQLLDAARRARDAGYANIDAYAPYPVEGLSEALGLRKNRIPMIFLIGGICGALTGFVMQVYANSTWGYPWNIGGRPHYSWPAFIPITFELTVLFAGLSGAFGMLALNGLPQPYHPVFNCDAFALASQTRLFLSIESSDAKFDIAQTRAFMESLNPLSIHEVPR
jgi:hypothetical protein